MAKPTEPQPRGPDNQVIYAIGDIHGRSDLLVEMIRLIEEDVAWSKAANPTLVFLGDYIDRGPDSRGVLECLVRLKARSPYRVTTLRGNHEQFLLSFLDEDSELSGIGWIEHGGRDTLASYGVAAPANPRDLAAWRRTASDLARAIPPPHLEVLKQTELMAVFGDYIFVHAGVRPNVPLADQAEEDLLNIRSAFLTAKRPSRDGVIVFGHSIFEQPLHETWKIGLDTGAYATGRLTGLRIDREHRALIST